MPPRRPPIGPPLGPAIVWAVLVGVASVTPVSAGQASPGSGLPLFAIAHVAGYAVLGALLVRGGVGPLRAVLIATALGLGLEGVQALFGFRTASLLDASLNLVGASMGVVIRGPVVRRWR